VKILLTFQYISVVPHTVDGDLSHSDVAFGVISRLYKQLTLVVDEPEKVYPTANVIWSRFASAFVSTFDLLTYAPVFKAYFYEALQQFYDDGVQYMELRSVFPPVFMQFYICYYPAPGRDTGYCFRAISFFVSMSARLRENGWTDLHEIFREGVE